MTSLSNSQIVGYCLLIIGAGFALIWLWSMLTASKKPTPTIRLTFRENERLKAIIKAEPLLYRRADFEQTYHVRLKPRQKGQALVEFALLLPVAMLCVLASLDVAVMMNAAQSVTFVVIQTANLSTANPTTLPNPAVTTGQSYAGGLGLNPAALSLSTTCNSTTCTASAQYTATPFGPWSPVVIHRTATATIPTS